MAGDVLREYGAITIFEEELETLDDGTAILSMIKNAGYQITSILYRGNDTITINVTSKTIPDIF